MFKVGLELPSEVVKEAPKQAKKNKKEKKTETFSGSELQRMMDELKAKEFKNPKKERKETDEETKEIKNQQKEERQERKKNGGELSKKKGEMPKKSEKKSADSKSSDSSNKAHFANSESQTQNQTQTQNQNQNQKPSLKRSGEELSRPAKKLTPLQLKMQQKLSGARFRWINEQLYTTNSQHAFDIFQKQPEVFKEYHDGFRHQVESWPENPVISFVEQFKDRLVKPLNAPGGLPGDKQANKVVVADMGCGEAELALRLSEQNMSRRNTRFEVHSFDMNPANERITVADIAHVPLKDESCHVVVFCLALMGTNLADFINEGIRILKPNGLVWIAEIKSRFENSDYTGFVDTLKNMGLYHRTTDDSNKMFVKFEFVKLPHKLAKAKDTNPEIHLKPCIYKRR